MRMRAQRLVELALALEVDPGPDRVLCKDIALEQEVVVRFEARSAPPRGCLACSLPPPSPPAAGHIDPLSIGSGGMIRFWIPSRPAMSSAASTDAGCWRDPAGGTQSALPSDLL